MFAKNKKQEIIIAGGGYFGSVLASQIDLDDNQVTVIDINGQTLNDFQSAFPGRTVEGDASNIEILRLAGINDASAVISATDDDHVNLMITLNQRAYPLVEYFDRALPADGVRRPSP